MRMKFLSTLVLAACTGVSYGQPASFKGDIVPVFKRQCMACHMTGEEQGRMGLAPSMAYTSLVNVQANGGPAPRVVPGDAQGSYLMQKLLGTHLDHGGSGVRMPMGFDPLSDEELAKIEAWINQGALDN
ncbi:hypothetical protein D9M69_435330 [compost metagenome]